MQKQTNFIKTQVRLPPEVHQLLVDFAGEHEYSLNSAIIELIKKGVSDNQPTATNLSSNEESSKSIIFGEFNCIHDEREIPLPKQQEYIAIKISDFFSRYPQYKLINIESLDKGRKFRYWYYFPKKEDGRNF